MADFVSQFWSWFVIVPTVAGIVYCFWLVYGNAGTRGQAPSSDGPETMGHVWDEDLAEYNNPLPRWWLNLFVVTLVFSIVYLALYPGLGSFAGVLGWTQTGQYEREMGAAESEYGPLFARYGSTPIEELVGDGDAMRTGERLFASYCSTCHGSDARGATGFPNLRDGSWQWGGDAETVKQTILKGRSAAMPGWQVALGDEGVTNVTEYVLSLAGRDHDAGAAEAGKEKFGQLCMACHTAAGTGNPLMGAPDLTDEVWLYGAGREAIRRSIGGGRNGRMPPHEEFLGADKVHLLAAYVYGLSRD
jgi:cytochrome c oxidase cbb3-type subunit 3